MENPHPQVIYTSRVTSPLWKRERVLFRPFGARVLGLFFTRPCYVECNVALLRG